MQFIINGQPREFPALGTEATVSDLVQELGIQADRVAIEHNGEIVPRTEWPSHALHPTDRLEIVHFVGGGCA